MCEWYYKDYKNKQTLAEKVWNKNEKHFDVLLE